jgi:hypothetical protein
MIAIANTKTQLGNLDKAGLARSSVAFRSDRTWNNVKYLARDDYWATHETPIQKLLAVLQELVRACVSHLPCCTVALFRHNRHAMSCYSTTLRGSCSRDDTRKNTRKIWQKHLLPWQRIPPAENKKAQTLSEASSSASSRCCCCFGGGVPSAFLTAASFSASLCSSALWPLSLRGTDNNQIKRDARLKPVSIH